MYELQRGKSEMGLQLSVAFWRKYRNLPRPRCRKRQQVGVNWTRSGPDREQLKRQYEGGKCRCDRTGQREFRETRLNN
ncbi:hypothetical protein J6590_066299 [Homalodisca vitripennis]|nr:hypothetical protein J6590_066299 [Homalodisca vitripennis]